MRRRRVGRHSRPGCRNTCPGEARATPEPPDRRPLPEVPVLPAAARFAPGSDKRQAQRGAEAPLLRTVPERKAVPAAPVETPDQAQASLRPLPLHMTGLRKRRPELLGQGPHPAAHPPRQVPAMPDRRRTPDLPPLRDCPVALLRDPCPAFPLQHPPVLLLHKARPFPQAGVNPQIPHWDLSSCFHSPSCSFPFSS